MRRAMIAALSVTTLLLVSSVVLITWATRDAPLVLDASSALEAPTPAAPPGAGAPDRAGPTVLAADVTETPSSAGSPGGIAAPPPITFLASALHGPSFAASGSQRRNEVHRAPAPIPPARRQALRGFRRELMAGIAGLEERVAGCSLAGASFSLAVESTEGGVRIVNAVIEPRGASTDADVACAQSALRGQLIPAPNIEPGKRWQIPLAVRARSPRTRRRAAQRERRARARRSRGPRRRSGVAGEVRRPHVI